MYIKTHGHVAVGKKAMWCTSVLFTGTVNLPFSTPSISITTGLIYIKFIHFMPSIYILYPPIYVTLHSKFEENQPSSLQDMCSLKLPHIFLLLLCTVLQR